MVSILASRSDFRAVRAPHERFVDPHIKNGGERHGYLTNDYKDLLLLGHDLFEYSSLLI